MYSYRPISTPVTKIHLMTPHHSGFHLPTCHRKYFLLNNFKYKNELKENLKYTLSLGMSD